MAHYVLKITLLGCKPAIWRRVVVPDDYNLLQLHTVIQHAMGWYDSHLHEFMRDGLPLVDSDDEAGFDCDYTMGPVSAAQRKGESGIKIGEVLDMNSPTLDYVYDFGDDWRHRIVLENDNFAVENPEVGVFCLKGKMACPPEDCGGPYMYKDICRNIAQGKAPRDEDDEDEMDDWFPADFDPAAFDLNDVNVRLHFAFSEKKKPAKKAVKKATTKKTATKKAVKKVTKKAVKKAAPKDATGEKD